MPSSSNRILRGLDVKGWKTYRPPTEQAHGEPGSGPETERPPVLTREEMDQAIREKEKRVLDRARQEAEKIRQDALVQVEKEAETIRKKAWEKGYKEALKKGEAEAGKLKKEAEAILKEAHAAREELLDGAESDIIQICINLAEKLLHCKIELTPQVIVSMISRSLEALPSGKEIVLKVHPENEKICRQYLGALKGLIKNGSSLLIEADEIIPSGSCLVASEDAEVEFFLFRELHLLGQQLLQTASQKQ